MKNFSLIIIFYILLSPAWLTAQGQRFYVDIQASGLVTGQSWTDAFHDLHDALALALPGDEIWVAEGVYRPATSDRAIRYQLPSGVKLYGGFAGSEMLLEERQAAAHPTLLSGDIGITGDSLDNSYTLLYLPYPDVNTLVDGFTFSDALSNNPNVGVEEAGAAGAALYIMGGDSVAYPTIRHCIFEHNTARAHGGAVFINGSGSGSVAPLFDNCQFYYNQANLNGGAIYRNGASWWERPADLNQCTFEYNRAVRGACFYLADAERSDTLQIVASNFYHNFATMQADVMALGRARQTGMSFIKFTKCDIAENLNKGVCATDVFFIEGNLDVQFDSCTLQHNVFSGSVSGTILVELAGQVKCSVMNCIFPASPAIVNTISSISYSLSTNSTLNIIKSSFEQCRISIVASDSKLNIENCVFNKSNAVNVIGYDYYSIKNTIFNKVGHLKLRVGRNIYIQNCVFFKNYVKPHLANTGFADSTVYVNNSIFWPLKDNPDKFYQELQFPYRNMRVQAKNCLFTDTLYYRAFYDLLTGIGPILGPGVQIGVDPLFLDTLNGDFHLDPCSPAWNTGDNSSTIAQGLTTDLDGQPRIVDGQVDIGACEIQALRSSGEGIVQAACFNQPQGAIQWSLQNGCPPYTYHWSNNGTIGNNTTGLAPGNYVFTVSDSRGRTLIQNVAIPASSPQVTLSGDTAICSGSTDGTLMALVNALLPVSYQWSNGNNTNSIDNLPVGSYVVTLTDAIGCKDTVSAVVVPLPMPVLTAQINKASSMITADGSIQVTVESGQPPYMYAWTEVPSTLPVISGLLPGTYHLSVTDGAGCTAPFQYEVGVTSATTTLEALEAGSVKPNPAREQALLHFGDSNTWQLFNVTGIEVLRVEGHTTGGLLPVDLSGLPSGIYFYIFSQNGKMISQDRLFILGN